MPLNNKLKPRINVKYQPKAGWTIRKVSSTNRFALKYNDISAEISLGSQFTYEYSSTLKTRGLARTSGILPKLRYEPADWTGKFGGWAEAIYPTANAESNANFLVVNAWDKAGITFGFIQLAAHTNDDFVLLMKRLIKDLPGEAAIWFPELAIVDGRVAYVADGDHRFLDEFVPPTDKVPPDHKYLGLFMEFFNPDRQVTDLEEVHAAARWVAWSLESAAMREVQVAHSISNMKDSAKLLHSAILADATAKAKYPQGIDGMAGDIFAAAIAVPHLAPKLVSRAVRCLVASDVLKAFETVEYGPGDREKTVVAGVRARGKKLSALRYNMSKENLV